MLGQPLQHEHSLADLLARPGVSYVIVEELASIERPDAAVSRETLCGELGEPMAAAVIEQAEITLRYAGYIEKQHAEVDRTASPRAPALAG